jgi:hypothetical protein
MQFVHFISNDNRHPCNQKPSVVADIGLRLQEGIQDLKLEQQLAPAREAVVRTFSTGSTNFLKAVEGVRGRWAQRNADVNKDGNGGGSISSSRSSSIAEAPVEVHKSDLGKSSPPMPTTTAGALRPFALGMRKVSNPNIGVPSSSLSSSVSGPSVSSMPVSPPPVGAALASWGAGIGSFISTRLVKQPSVQGPEQDRESRDNVSSASESVEGKDVKGQGERAGGERAGGERAGDERARTSVPVLQPVTPPAASRPKVNVTSPGGTTPDSGVFGETPPSTGSTAGKTRVTSAGANGAAGRVRAAVLERERAQVSWSPKDVTSGVRLPARDVGDKVFPKNVSVSSPPRRANSNIAKEAEANPYPQRKDDVHFRDPFTAPRSQGSDELHHKVDPLHYVSQDDSHRASTASSAYSNSLKSLDEQDAYAGMAL